MFMFYGKYEMWECLKVGQNNFFAGHCPTGWICCMLDETCWIGTGHQCHRKKLEVIAVAWVSEQDSNVS